MTIRSRTVLCLALAAATAGCSSKKEEGGGAGSTGGIVTVDGSSTVALMSQAAAEAFRGTGNATVAASGTGGGFKKFCRGEVDVAGASRPIKDEEAKICKDAGIEFIEVPVAYDGLAVIVHPKNDWVDHFTVAELKKIWEPDAQKKITSWAQVRDGWPDRPLVLFGPGTDSGTFDYFTHAIVGKEKSSRGDYTANEDDNVLVTGVAGEVGSLGYFGYAYYGENKERLRVVPIEAGKGPVTPSEQTVKDGTYQPLSRPLFIYVSTKSLERGAVQKFVELYLQRAGELATSVGYVPLSDKAYELAVKRVGDKKTGSTFHGSTTGVSIEKVLEGGG